MKQWNNIFIGLKNYLLIIPIFFCFRFILFLTEISKIESLKLDYIKVFQSFIIGLRFDLVIAGYILLLPFITISAMHLLNKHNRLIYKIVFLWTFILFSLTFTICAADIPYFNQFFTRFDTGAFQWIDSPVFVLKMIVQEPRYIIILIPLALVIAIYYKQLKKIIKPPAYATKGGIYFLRITVTLLFLGLMFVGIRGRVQKKSPIRIGTAYFSDNAFLNQLGLNPVFTLIKSYEYDQHPNNKRISLIEDEQAIAIVQSHLKHSFLIPDFPIARLIAPDTINDIKYNVVLIIMESMSAAKMKRHGSNKEITPFLDSISNHSYYFENIYTAGKHTFNGIFSTLFSFPAIFKQHPMKKSPMNKFNGIASTLKKNGYSTTYFTTHDGQFDNVEGFLRGNGFDNVITQADYPSKEVKTALGVPDDYMFRFSMPIIDQLSQQNQPFFVTFMTASDHGPYYVPDYFKAQSRDIKDRIVEYADWSLKTFIAESAKKDWFDNTLFVFIADHGAAIKASYDISLDYHHTPLIFYAPKLLKENKTFNCIGGQIDVFPTLMGFLKQPYINNTLGIDLLKEKRPYIIINDDDKFGVLDNDYLLIVRQDNSAKLFNYLHNDKKDYIKDFPDMAYEMETYGKSHLQLFQYLLHNNKQYVAVE